MDQTLNAKQWSLPVAVDFAVLNLARWRVDDGVDPYGALAVGVAKVE